LEIGRHSPKKIVEESMITFVHIYLYRSQSHSSTLWALYTFAYNNYISNSAALISRCWGGNTGWQVEDAKDKITKLLEEYEAGGDLGEACHCIRDIGMPFFNHEVVKKALIMAMEKKNDKMLDLLSECFGEGLISINQLTKGFMRVRDGMDDLTLDIPNAREKFDSYVSCAGENGWLLGLFV
jgi:MA3 domain